MDNCIFCKIRDGEIPKEFTYQDEEIMVFPDIHPLKPIHLLIVPKKHLEDFLDLSEPNLSQKTNKTIQKMIKEHQLENAGYRLLINGGGAQAINHLHIHLMGPMGKMVKMV